MNHFKPKSLIFYAVAIGSVVLLFNRVTAYGNSNLKAPPKVEGNYPINIQNWPRCLKPNSPMLQVNQSGVYLTGSFFENGAAAATSSEEKASLTGQFQGKEMSLAGPIPHSSCPAETEVTVQGRVDKATFSGQIAFNADPPIQFSSQRQPKAPAEGEGK